MSTPTQSTPKAQQNATDWLHQTLAAGAAESAHIKVLAEQAGIGTKALRNARERLGVLVARHGGGTTMRSVWSLPEMYARAGGDGIRAHPSKRWRLLTPVKVSDLANPDISRRRISPPKEAFPAAEQVVAGPDAKGRELLGDAWPLTAATEQTATTELTSAEQDRLVRRSRQFVQRGMNGAASRELAIRLVVERDRTASRTGSCIECQCLERSSCAPGAEGHTPGPRDPAEIWMCWCARRHG